MTFKERIQLSDYHLTLNFSLNILSTASINFVLFIFSISGIDFVLSPGTLYILSSPMIIVDHVVHMFSMTYFISL